MSLEEFIFSGVILLVTASLMVVLFRHLGLGSIAGLLVAGMLVGPHTPGPYITTHVEGIRNFTELGVVMLLFVIGLEIKPSRLWALRRDIFGLGTLQIVITALAVICYALLIAWPWKAALVIGMTMAVSSTALVMQMLRDRGEVASPHGRSVFAILLMQDLAIIPMLAFMRLFETPGQLSGSIFGFRQAGIILGTFIALWSLGKYCVPFALERLARQRNREGFLMVTILSVFFSAWAMHEAGLSLALGAFLMGMFLSGSPYNIQIEAYIEPYKGILVSLFFVAVGMSIDIASIAATPFSFLQLIILVLIIKTAIIFLLCLFFRIDSATAVRVSFLLAQGGEFGFVLLSSAKVLAVIEDTTFVLGIGVISMTMLFTPVMVKLGDWLADLIRRRSDRETSVLPLGEPGSSKGRVIIGGYGRVGHVVAVLLHASGVPFIVFDNDPVRVTRGKQDGFPVHYGDIANPELLLAAHIEEAALVVLTVDREQTVLQAISHVKNSYPALPVIARARDLEASARMVQAGATLALPEAVESSLRLANDVLRLLGMPTDNIDLLLRDARRRDYELVKPGKE